MTPTEGYMEVSYRQLQKVMQTKRKESGITDIAIAQGIKVKSLQTVTNGFNQEIQKISDEKLTHIMKVIGVDGLIVYSEGKKKFYLSKN